MKIRAIIRGYGNGVKLFEDRVEVDDISELTVLAELHCTVLAKYKLHMLEVELPDAPKAERFLRFGTDPSRMGIPYEVKL